MTSKEIGSMLYHCIDYKCCMPSQWRKVVFPSINKAKQISKLNLIIEEFWKPYFNFFLRPLVIRIDYSPRQIILFELWNHFSILTNFSIQLFSWIWKFSGMLSQTPIASPTYCQGFESHIAMSYNSQRRVSERPYQKL